MIQVDTRAGSGPLIPILRSIGCEVEGCIVPFGDIVWSGVGANDTPISVGVEAKNISDVVACITSGRFAGHQLPGLIASYDYVWLLIAGEWGPRSTDGALMEKKLGPRGAYWSEVGGGQRRWLARDVESWVLSMEVMGGIRTMRVPDWNAGCQWIKTCYNWFQKSDHKSHRVVYEGKHLFPDRALLTKPSLARRVAAQLPSVGDVRSADVARKFPTLESMVNASAKEWMSVEGFGPGIAKKVFSAIHGNNGSGKL